MKDHHQNESNTWYLKIMKYTIQFKAENDDSLISLHKRSHYLSLNK